MQITVCRARPYLLDEPSPRRLCARLRFASGDCSGAPAALASPLLVTDTKLKFPSLRSVIFVKCRPRSEFRGGVVPSCSPPLGKIFCEAPAICADEDSPGWLRWLQTVCKYRAEHLARTATERADVLKNEGLSRRRYLVRDD